MLLAWLFAGAHVVLEHGGVALGAHPGEAAQGEHHHDEGPSPADGDQHQHEFGAASVQWAKSAEKQFIAPQWTGIHDRLLAELAALVREAGAPDENSQIGDAPPDARMSGWLFVIQTALPVRGPSLA